MKSFLTAFVIVLIITGLTYDETFHLSVAQTGTQVAGTISSDTTWSQANSPYKLTGDVEVSSWVTLTVEAGTVVNLGGSSINVDGTFYARGSNINEIIFNNGQITFSKSSTIWNEQAGSGCLIERSVLNAIEMEINSAIKINNNTIVNSTMGGSVIHIPVGSPIISNNIIIDPQAYDLIWCGGSATISNNTLIGGECGMQLEGAFAYGLNSGTVTVSNNTVGSLLSIDNGCSGTIIVENNLIEGYLYVGIEEQNVQTFYATIKNNTFVEGLYLQSSPTIIYNNILHNDTSNSIYDNDGGVNASYNWWGTTDANAILQSIHEYNASYVNFTPFLTSPNLQAPAIPAKISYLTPTPSTSPTPTPSVPELSTWIILPLVIMATVLAAALAKKGKRISLNNCSFGGTFCSSRRAKSDHNNNGLSENDANTKRSYISCTSAFVFAPFGTSGSAGKF